MISSIGDNCVVRGIRWKLLWNCLGITLCASLGQAQGAESKTWVSSGILNDQAGRPVPYAYVFVDGHGAAVSNSEGQFRLRENVLAGSVAVGVRRIGFVPFDTIVVMREGPPSELRIALRPIANQLDTVRIEARASDYDDYLDRAGYYQRMTRAVDGTFLTYRDLEKRNSPNLTGVLRDVDGVRVVSRGGRGGKNDYVLGRGGLCALGLVINGQRVEINNPPVESVQPRVTAIMGSRAVSAVETPRTSGTGASLDELVNPSMVSAVEVYPSATSVPNALQHLAEGCGLIVVWTRFR